MAVSAAGGDVCRGGSCAVGQGKGVGCVCSLLFPPLSVPSPYPSPPSPPPLSTLYPPSPPPPPSLLPLSPLPLSPHAAHTHASLSDPISSSSNAGRDVATHPSPHGSPYQVLLCLVCAPVSLSLSLSLFLGVSTHTYTHTRTHNCSICLWHHVRASSL